MGFLLLTRTKHCRHVRVHHVDKDRDDEALRDVLNQRTEGQGKTRRRRTNTITTAVAAA